MTIESLEIMQKRTRRSDIPHGELSIEQASLSALYQIVDVLAEIAIELKQARMHEDYSNTATAAALAWDEERRRKGGK